MSRKDFSKVTGFNDEVVNTVLSQPAVTTQILKTGWSRAECLRIAQRFSFDPKLKDSVTQRSIIVQFLKFYVTGNVDEGYDPMNIILSTASLLFKPEAKTSQDLMWEESSYNTTGPHYSILEKQEITLPLPRDDREGTSSYTLLIEDTDTEQIWNGLTKGSAQEAPTVYLRTEDDLEKLTDKVRPLLHDYSSIGHKTFIDYINKVLSQSPTTNAPTIAALQLYQMCNFVALTMLRAVTKTNAQLTTGFLKTQYRTNICQLLGGQLSEFFVPPCTRCLSQVSAHIIKTKRPISSFFSLLVLTSTTENCPIEVKAVLDATVLTHTSWNGLGILHMIFSICTFNNISWVELYKFTLFDKTATTWRKIIEFLTIYQRHTGAELTVPWARVIDDAYLTKYGPMDHPFFASLLRASLARAQGDETGLEDAVWAIKHRQVVQQCRRTSERLADLISHTATQLTAGTEESSGLAQIFNEDLESKEQGRKSPNHLPSSVHFGEDEDL